MRERERMKKAAGELDLWAHIVISLVELIKMQIKLPRRGLIFTRAILILLNTV